MKAGDSFKLKTRIMFDLISIVVTVIFSIAGISFSYWLYARKKRPCEILFLSIDCINVYDKLSLDFDSLEILANGQTVDNDLLFFSGVFVCNGHADIKGNNHTIRLELPDSCKWKDVKISSKSRGLIANIKIKQPDNKTAKLIFGQFRMSEFITVKGLVECRDKGTLRNLDNFYNKIKFFHRIEDTENVNLGTVTRRQVRLWKHLAMQIPFMLMVILSFKMILDGSVTSPLCYQDKDTKAIYHAQVNENDNIVLWDITSLSEIFGRPEKEVNPIVFRDQYSIKMKYEKYSLSYLVSVVILGGMTLFLLVFLFIRNKHYFRDRRLLRMYIGER